MSHAFSSFPVSKFQARMKLQGKRSLTEVWYEPTISRTESSFEWVQDGSNLTAESSHPWAAFHMNNQGVRDKTSKEMLTKKQLQDLDNHGVGYHPEHYFFLVIKLSFLDDAKLKLSSVNIFAGVCVLLERFLALSDLGWPAEK